MIWAHKDLIGMDALDRDDIENIFDIATSFKEISTREIKKIPTLRGKTVVLLFYEPSTRTRMSFEIAAKRLSADTVSLSASGSSFEKEETILDATRNIMTMAPDCIVIRYPHAGIPELLAQTLPCSIINAGDGFHEHPTQALLDIYSMREHFGYIKGLNVLIAGDIMHSRVAKSNVYGLKKFGANVTLVAPKTLMPPGIDKWGADVCTEFDSALPDADVVMMLRIQKERMEQQFFSGEREYALFYGLDKSRVEKMKKGAIIMHPGPVNRGVEITYDATESARSVILDQVKNGLAIRMALLYLFLGGGKRVD